MEETGCIYIIREKYNHLSSQEKKIADYVLANTKDAVSLSINELAATVGTSVSTVVRFARHLGYESYQLFRLALVRGNVIHDELIYEVPVSDDSDVVGLVFDSAIKTLTETEKRISRESIRQAASLLKNARRICLMGMGGSNTLAYNAYHKLIRLGLNCQYTQEFHMQLMLASQLIPEDVVILFCHTGVDNDAIAMRNEIKARGAKIICLCSRPNTPILEGCDIALTVYPCGESIVSESFSARIAHMALIDIIYVQLMKELDGAGENALAKTRDAMAKRSL